MDHVLAGLHWETCLFHLDDSIIFATTWEEHLACLRQVFECLRYAQLKLGTEKCTFAAKEVSYLGHRVTSEGLLPDPTLLAAIREIGPHQDCHRSLLILGPRRVLPVLCQKFRRHRPTPPRPHQERHGLLLESGVSRHLRPPQNPPHHQPHHCLPGLQPAVPAIHRRLHCRPRSNSHTSTGRQGTHYLLCLMFPQPSREGLPCHETRVPRHRLSCCQIPPLTDVHVIRSLYQPLCATMARDDAHGIRPPSSMVSSTRRVRFHCEAPPREIADPRRRTQPLACRPPTSRRCYPPSTAAGGRGRSPGKSARELHTATHLSDHALWKLFCDRYSHKAGHRICLETAQSCPQCQLGTDYGHHQKTTGTIQSQGPWDTLSVDIVGPLPTDRRQEFLIVFVDCFSKYTILIPSSNHTVNTVSEALMRYVIP